MTVREEKTVGSNRYIRKSVRGTDQLIRVLYVHINANENMACEPLHEVHGVTVRWGESVMWFAIDAELPRLT